MIIPFLNKYKWLIIPILVVIISVIIIMTANVLAPKDPPREYVNILPTPFPATAPELQKTSPIQQTIIGKTTKEEVEQLPGRVLKEEIEDGSVRYSFSSALVSRPDTIIVKEDRVIYETIITPESPHAQGHTTIDHYQDQYGEPEAVLNGSKFYGWHMRNYIYAQQGFVLIANPYTGEVFEIHAFQPMTTEEYIQYYGNDISPEAQPAIEGH